MNTSILDKLKADIAKLDDFTELPLPAYGSWPATVHQFDEDSRNVLKTDFTPGN